jgi:hypothetical protein
MSETADLMHHVPGRLRMRLPLAKKNPSRLRAIQDALAGWAGISRVDANPTLGTVVIYYDPALYADFPRALADYARQHDLFGVGCDDVMPCISETDRSVNRIFGEMNRKVQEATKNLINLKELLPLAMAGYGFLFVDRAAAAAQWLNWLQFAFDTYLDLHEDEPVEELGQRVEALGARILERNHAATEMLRSELAALRAEVRQLTERLPEPRSS